MVYVFAAQIDKINNFLQIQPKHFRQKKGYNIFSIYHVHKHDKNYSIVDLLRFIKELG